jgi:NAD kinase
MTRIRRAGVVAKARLQAAAEHLVQVAARLDARHIEVVFDPDSAALATAAGAGSNVTVVEKDRLPAQVDMILALGGDGTLLGMAGRIGQATADIHPRRELRQPLASRGHAS